MTQLEQDINYGRILEDCLSSEDSIQAVCDKVGISRSSFYRFRSTRRIPPAILKIIVNKYHLDLAYYIEFQPDFG